jgi:tetratricopeptide (TPR) repeat protein
LLGDMGFAQHLAGRNLEADRYYRLATDRFRALGRQESQHARRLLLDWGLVKYAMGDFRSGLRIFEEAIEAAQRVRGSEPIPPSILGNRAFGLEQLGRYDEALAVYRATFEEAERTGFVAAKAYALAGSANVLVSMGDVAGAQAALDRATPLLRGLADAQPARIRHALVQARIEAAGGNLQAAFGRYTDVIGLMTKQGITHPALANAYRQRAEVALRLNQPDDALTDARSAVDMARTLQSDVPHSDLTGLCWLTLGRVLRDRGDIQGSRVALETAETNLRKTLGEEHPDTRTALRLMAGR